MKRFLSLFLAITLLLSLFPATALNAAATELEEITSVDLVDVPEYISIGPAFNSLVQTDSPVASVTEEVWLDENGQPVSEFTDGNVYYLQLTITAREGYKFYEYVELMTHTHHGYTTSVTDQVLTATIRYSLLPDVGDIYITANEPALGMTLSDLTATVEGNVTLEGISIYCHESGIVTAFTEGKNYTISYSLRPKEGYDFTDADRRVALNDDMYAGYSIRSGIMDVYMDFTTCTPIDEVMLNITEILPGTAAADVQVTVGEADANYSIGEITIHKLGSEEDETWTTFDVDGQYSLYFEIFAKEGYTFTGNTHCTINGGEGYQYFGLTTYTSLSIDISFGIDELYLMGMPECIEAGAAEIPTLYMDGNAAITAVRWCDSNNTPVTEFQDGEEYRLAVTLAPLNGAIFNGTPEIQLDTYNTPDMIFEPHSNTELVIYFCYSLAPSAGDIAIEFTAPAVGESTLDPEISVEGHAQLNYVQFYQCHYLTYDGYTSEPLEDATIQAGLHYMAQIHLTPEDGYRFLNDSYVYLNGQEIYDVEINEQYIVIRYYFNTCTPIDTVTLTMPEVTLDKDISAMQISVPRGANYTASVKWYDNNLDEYVTDGTLQDGHRYDASITIIPKDGFCFEDTLSGTLNGSPLDLFVGMSGASAFGNFRKSFAKPIAKVELPAMPTAIRKDQQLPTLSVADTENYRLYSFWTYVGEEESEDDVTTADKDGSYFLIYTVTPKDGYELSEDTEYYVGGKELAPIEAGDADAQFMQIYNVGIPEITTLQLIHPLPEEGADLPELDAPAGADYVILYSYWLQNATGKNGDWEEVTSLTPGLPTIVVIVAEALNGKYLSGNMDFYVNGQKVSLYTGYNLGYYGMFALDMGRYGQAAPLTAPVITADGYTLSWNAQAGAIHYEIYRATSKSGKYTKVATVEDTCWQDAITVGKTYYYKVKAISAVTEYSSGLSSYVSIAYKCDAPEITVQNNASGAPVITWEKVSGAKKYTVYRATSENGKYTKLGTSTKPTYTDKKAKAGTLYFYKVIANASKSTYNSTYSNIVSCYGICATPSVTVKIDTASGKPTLSWKKISGAAGYRIFRQLPGEETFTELATQTAVTFKDTTAPIDTLCTYRVQTVGKVATADSACSSPITATSGIAQPKLQGGVNTEGYPHFNWQQVEGAEKYVIYRSTKSNKSYTVLATVEDGNAYVDTTVAPGKTYYYKVEAVGAESTGAASAYIKLTGKCAAPQSTVEIDTATGKPMISWEKVSGAKKYTVYRSTEKFGTYKKLGTTTKLTYIDKKATVGKTYFYKVIANASSGKNSSTYSYPMGAQTICAMPQITTSVTNSGNVKLSWKKITGAVRYEIWLEQAGAKEQLGSTTSLSFVDEAAAPGETRIYWVYAVDANGNFACDDVVATTVCGQPTLNSHLSDDGKPAGRWNFVEGAAGYRVYRSTKKSSGYKIIDELPEFCDFFIDDTAVKGKTYYYKIVPVCLDEEGEPVDGVASNIIKIKSK